MTVASIALPTRGAGDERAVALVRGAGAARGEAARPGVGARLAWLAVAVGLFLPLYGGCLWVTSLRADVPSLCFGWERHIPYVPWMIWPYLSIDVFFVGSFFVCGRGDELTALGRRLVLATVVAAACFLCFPLRYALVVPVTPGILGQVAGAFRTVDRPLNLAPSLHVAFGAILWVGYVRHTRGMVRAAVKVWFVLIAVSTLLVYQHHAIDVAGGLFLGMVCLHLVPEARSGAPRGNGRGGLAWWYSIGAGVAAAVALVVGGWGYLLLWPAGSLGLVAAAYVTGDADVFRKRDGRIPRSTWVVHAPYLLGQRVAWWVQRRGARCLAASRVTPSVTIGRVLTGRELAALAPAAVIDLTAEFGGCKLRGANYVPLPMLDLTVPTVEMIARAVRAVQAAASEGGEVYVHCALGYGRAALVAAAYLVASGGGVTVDEAVARVRSKRPGAVFSAGAIRVLRQFALSWRRTAATAAAARTPSARATTR